VEDSGDHVRVSDAEVARSKDVVSDRRERALQCSMTATGEDQ
jgi:hypothetical protein